MDGQRILGMVTDTDLLQRQSASPLYVLGEAFRAGSQEELVDAARGLAPLLVAMVQANASARSIGYVVSSVGAAINSRLLSLAEAELGPPPVAYAWMAGGALARHEQSARSDQDNCLLLAARGGVGLPHRHQQRRQPARGVHTSSPRAPTRTTACCSPTTTTPTSTVSTSPRSPAWSATAWTRAATSTAPATSWP